MRFTYYVMLFLHVFSTVPSHTPHMSRLHGGSLVPPLYTIHIKNLKICILNLSTAASILKILVHGAPCSIGFSDTFMPDHARVT